MTILITGGAGFVGSNLTLRLLKDNHQVIAVDNFITSARDNLIDLKKYPNFKFFELDVNSSDFFRIFFRRQIKLDAIYHLACPTGVPNCVKLAEEMIETCSFGSKNVLNLARAHHCPVVVTSTAEAYGDPEIFPQTESYNGNVSTTGLRSPYEEGKRFAEAMVAMYARKYDLNAKIARLFNAYGPRMSVVDSRANANLIRQALANEPLTIHGDGEQTRTFCYVDDTVSGLMAIMRHGQSGEIYNLGSDEPITINNLAKKIIELTNSSSVIKLIPHPLNADHRGRCPNIDKLKALGWQRRVILDDGLMRMIAYLKQSQESRLPAATWLELGKSWLKKFAKTFGKIRGKEITEEALPVEE